MRWLLFCAVLGLGFGCCPKQPSTPPPEVLQFEKSRSAVDLEKLFSAANHSSDHRFSVFSAIHEAVFPASWQSYLDALKSIDRARASAERAICLVGRVRGENYDLLRYLEVAAVFMERWNDIRWRVSVIEAFCEYQIELLEIIRKEFVERQLDNTTDYGTLRVSKMINVVCSLGDLTNRYHIKEHLSQRTQECLALCLGLITSPRSEFTPRQINW